MASFDIFVCIVLGVSLIYSVLRGMVREIFSLLAVVGGYLLAIHYQSDLADIVGKQIPNETAATLISFSVLFIAGGMVISFIGKGIRALARSTPGLSATDRLVGGAIGVVKGLVFIGVAMFAMNFFPDFNRQALKDSHTAPHMQKASDWLVRTVAANDIFDSLPDLSVDGLKKQLKKLPDLKELKDELIKRVGETNDKKEAPLDTHTKEDKEELEKILKSVEKN